MGLFSSLFGSGSGAERMILRHYPPMLQGMTGMPATEAQRMTRELLKACKQEAASDGSDKMIANFGDSFLERARTDSGAAAMLDEKRKRGAKDDDIRWWWNLDDLERRMMDKVDEMSRIAMFTQRRESGISAEDAAAQVKKVFPIYGPAQPRRWR